MTLLTMLNEPPTCLTCGGTQLQATVGGVPRGTCRCKKEEGTTDDAPPKRVRGAVVSSELPPCCVAVVAQYEVVDAALVAEAKQRGGIALACAQRHRVTYVDGAWRREDT